MTLVYLESFDNFADDSWLQLRYPSGFNPITVSVRAGRHGGNSLGSDAVSGTQAVVAVPTDDEYTVGIAMRMLSTADTGSGNQGIIFNLGATAQFSLRLEEVGTASDEWRIEVRRGGFGGTLIATQTQAQHLRAWHYIEIKVLAHATLGTYEVKLDGVQLAELTDTNVDTTGAGSPNIDNIDIFIHQDGEIDDVYVLNNAGSANNDFLGPLYVEGLLPDADGNQSDFTPSAGANWSTVDEAGIGSLGSDYNESSTVNHVDLYTFGNLVRIDGASVNIVGVELVSLMALSVGGSEDMSHMIRSGASEHTASAQSVTSTSQVAFSDVFETDLAAGAAWSVASVDAIEFGVEKTT